MTASPRRPRAKRVESAESDAASAAATPSSEASGSGARVLKKYPNRRLYDTRSSGYITLSDVKQMVLKSEAFEVRDAKTGEDLTRAILLQILLEEEAGGMPMFSNTMLAQMIRFYGHAMQGLMGSFMEKNLLAMVEMQNRFAEQTRGLYDPSSLTADGWAKLMRGHAPLMQGLMGQYAEQSRKLFAQMQEQFASGALFPGFGSFPHQR